MQKLKIIIDSTSDMTSEEISKLDIDIIPLYVILKGVQHVSSELNDRQLFEFVDQERIIPKTAAISSEAARVVFKKYLDQNYDVLFICMSKELSGTYNAARVAIEDLDPNHIRIISNDSASLATRILIHKALKMLEEGLPFTTIADNVQALVPKIQTHIVLGTLKYLYYGGRVSSFGRFLGQALRMHPHIYTKEGKIIVYKNLIGRLSKCYMSLVDEFMKYYPNIDLEMVCLIHCDADQADLEMIVKALSKVIDPKSIIVTEASSIVAAHCGPKAASLIFLTK